MNTNRTKQFQMSDSFLTAALVALSGGAQDAYTYFGRGKVFANAQTGNVVLFSSNLMSGQTAEAMVYLIPVFSFLLGVFAAEHIRRTFRERPGFHWRQLVLLLEIILLTCVGFIPQTWNSLANAIVSFVCAMQVQTFRKVCGNAYASTMCIGNLRSCMDALHSYVSEKDPMHLFKSLIYLGVILFFGLGAGVGYLLTAWIGSGAIWFSCALLLCAFCAMQSGNRQQSGDRETVGFGIVLNSKNQSGRNYIMKEYQNEMKQYLSLNELTTGGGLVIFGGSMDRMIPVGELKQSFNLSMSIYNRSLSHLRVKAAVDAYDGCAAELNPESLILHLGAEDVALFQNDAAGFLSAYRALIDHVRVCTPKCRIAIVSIENTRRDLSVQEMNRQLKNLAESERCEYCEINGLVWNPRGQQELMDFMYDLGFVRPLKIKRPLYDLVKILYGSVCRLVETEPENDATAEKSHIA